MLTIPSKYPEPTIVKKYANRRLYNTATSMYITLEDLHKMIQEGEDFVVQDAKTNEDITRSVLTQVIIELESNPQNEGLLPTNFLKALIGFYGHSVQWAVPKYLEIAMHALMTNQERLQGYMMSAFGNQPKDAHPMSEMTRQSQAVMQQAMQMFQPFAASGTADMPAVVGQLQQQIQQLTQQMQQLQQSAMAPMLKAAGMANGAATSSSNTAATGAPSSTAEAARKPTPIKVAP